MPAVSDCPNVAHLRQFVLGFLGDPEARQLEQHVGTCPHCLQRLGALAADDPLERALGDTAGATPTPLGDLAAALIPKLKRLRSSDATVSHAPETATTQVPAPNPSWDFLEPPQTADELGRLGPYQVLRLLGRGGMGVVFLAEDPRLKRRLALKVIHPSLVTRDDVRERFLREAQAVAAVEHENIVAIFEVNEHRGVPYLAMPLLHGESLDDRLERVAGPLPTPEILRIGREVAEGLAAAHARGLVHRDIKPANIFLVGGEPSSPRTKVKVLDFGLARSLGGADANRAAGPAGDCPQLTREGAITGTPAFMAPEQVQGQPVDGRADLFSLGCVLYRMATGRAPFPGDNTYSVLLKVLTETPPAPAGLNPGLPPALAGLIVQLLAKQREDRPPSAHAVAETLRALEADLAGTGRPKLSRRRWLLSSAAGAVAAVALTAGLIKILRPQPVSEEPGEITFDYAEPDGRLALRRGAEDEQVIDLAEARTRALPPGHYSLRPVGATGRRWLDPKELLVKPGEKRTLGLRLVGEVGHHAAHHARPIGGVAPIAGKAGPLVLAVSEDRTFSVWDPAAGDKAEVHWHRESPLRCVAVSADGRRAATGSGDVGPRALQLLRLWDVEALGQPRVERECHSQVNALAFSPDGRRLLSAEHDGTLVLCDAQTLTVEWQVRRAHDALGTFAVAWLPGGNQVLTGGGDGQMVLCELLQDEPVRTLRGHDAPVRAVAVLPGGKQAVSAGFDATIRVWELDTGREARCVPARAKVWAAAVCPDGRRLLTGGDDGAVRLWDLGTGQELVGFEGHGKAVTAVAFLPGGRRAVSGGNDGVVRLWELPN